jgi:hypothetical protein
MAYPRYRRTLTEIDGLKNLIRTLADNFANPSFISSLSGLANRSRESRTAGNGPAAAVVERLSSVKNSAESDKLPAFSRTLRV